MMNTYVYKFLIFTNNIGCCFDLDVLVTRE